MARSNTARTQDTTVLSQGTEVRGRVSGDGDLRVEGLVAGEISLKGAVSVAESGQVHGDVEASSLSIEGLLEGDISATAAVSLGSSARVRGDVRGATFTMDEGATFAGRVEMDFELPTELVGKGGR